MAHNGSQHFAYQHHAVVEQQSLQPIDLGPINDYHFGDEDDTTLLEPTMIVPGLTTHHHYLNQRRPSLPQTHGVLSPSDSQGWDPSYASGPTMEPASSVTPAQYREDAATYRAQSSSRLVHTQLLMRSPWSQHQDSPSGAPTSIDMLPQQVSMDSSQLSHLNKANKHSSMSEQPFFPAQQVQTPISPQSHQEWMALAQRETESRALSKRMRPGSPLRHLPDLRRDGAIQKKNKRIEIPQERNIQTIDHLIENTKDEDMLKELKAQKRLLRNREAALASRQRKKKHTEDLEKSEKNYMGRIHALEKDVETLVIERNNLHRDREILMHQHQDAERVIESMQMEKRDLVMKHTEETASLRRKVQVLMEQLEAASAPAMSAAPSSTGFNDFNAEMEALSMGAHDWDNFMLLPDMPADTSNNLDFGTPHGDQSKLSTVEDIKPAANMSESTAITPTPNSSTDKPIASGLLFMLLLCGAFVASQPAVTSNLNMPPIPPDVQAAAPTVLNNLLADNSIASVTHAHAVVRQAQHEPVPSQRVRSNGRTSNRMQQLHRDLTAPTRQQEIETAFALTQAQYAALTNSDLPEDDHHDAIHQTPRTLAQSLTDQFDTPNDNKAAVYTRSLLWDQIPADVVQQFKRMVQSHADLNVHNQQLL